MGENKDLERQMTYHDYVAFKDYPKYAYDKDEQVLYIPRGFDSHYLEEWNKKPITIVDNNTNVVEVGFGMTQTPININEEKAIRFLVGEGEFKDLRYKSQKVLIMPPGMGKTYSAVAAIQKLHMRSLIIMRTQNLKDQWLARIKEYTTMGGPNIVQIESSYQLLGYMKKPPSKNKKVFIVTRSLLMSYINRYGAKSLSDVIERMGIGVKVFDEAHQEYARTLIIDYATNVRYTFYLTATFKLSNTGDDRVFQRAFYGVPKLQLKRDDSERHIIYLAVLFNSHPNAVDIARITGGKRKFNRFAYIEYELNKGLLQEHFKSLINFFLVDKKLHGKTLVLSSKKSTCDYFGELADKETDGKFKTCAFYTGNKVENYKGFDIISATSQMLGTGEDIPGLRFMHNTEPFASLPNTDQFSGRLRPYDHGTKPTYYIEYIDVGFDKLYQWYLKRKKLLETKAKECKELNYIIKDYNEYY